ncbi:MAG: MlaA family lipoprotein, partial [Nitrospirota bacterium]|nr:MlaA family lipoprotein [Nitrospirota bacterium]
MALWAQKWELDQQITVFEQRIADVRQRSIDFQATSLVVARLEPQDQSVVDDESEVPQLDEYTVQDTYLDPFDDENTEEVDDPWEDFNASVFDFNLNLDRNFVNPVAKGYHYIMPDFAERALGNAFSNVRVLPRLVNNLFQGKVQQAGVVLGRFLSIAPWEWPDSSMWPKHNLG